MRVRDLDKSGLDTRKGNATSWLLSKPQSKQASEHVEVQDLAGRTQRQARIDAKFLLRA
jgi:hypothetical protein